MSDRDPLHSKHRAGSAERREDRGPQPSVRRLKAEEHAQEREHPHHKPVREKALEREISERTGRKYIGKR